MTYEFEIKASLAAIHPNVKDFCESVATNMHEFGYDTFTLDIMSSIGIITFTSKEPLSKEVLEKTRLQYQDKLRAEYPKHNFELHAVNSKRKKLLTRYT